jgi:hypothetical protein
MLEVERECERALELYLAQHPERADRWGEFSAEGDVPSRLEVEREYRALHVQLPPHIRQRLQACRSVMRIEDPGDLRSNPLQLSLLRFILARIGEGLIMFDDYPLERTDAVLESLRRRPGAVGFSDPPHAEHSSRGAPTRPPSEVRALRILEVVHHAERNMDLAVDLREALSRLPPLSRNYLALLYEEGMVDDLKASRLLGVKPEELEPAIDSLEHALREIAPA